MVVKKSELYSSIWSSCDELRGGRDASQYKDYVPALLFIKYVSDRFAGRSNFQVADINGSARAARGFAEIEAGTFDKFRRDFVASYRDRDQLHSFSELALG
jgi:type I restriction enzyme M protein